MIITPAQITGKTNEHIVMLNSNVGIHQQMLTPWNILKQAASEQGFDLTIASGFRDFDRQLLIWNNKCLGNSTIKDQQSNPLKFSNSVEDNIAKIHAILLYSALPGTSRHHWGCDIDVYAKNQLPDNTQLQLEPWEYQEHGYFNALTLWLQQHASSYGFYFPYDKFRGGIAAEPWHLSYLPIAQQFQQQLTIGVIEQCIELSNIEGKRLILANLADIYQRYIININGSMYE